MVQSLKWCQSLRVRHGSPVMLMLLQFSGTSTTNYSLVKTSQTG